MSGVFNVSFNKEAGCVVLAFGQCHVVQVLVSGIVSMSLFEPVMFHSCGYMPFQH